MRKVAELMSLKGRAALVTGGGGHLGYTIAETLAELGASIVIADVDEAACRAASERLASAGFTAVTPLTADLSDESATRMLVDASLRSLGRLDVLVHCAAFVGTTRYPGWAEPFERQSVSAWDAAFRVNVTAAFTMVQQAAPALRESGHASVILVSSIYGMVGPDFSLYDDTPMTNPAAYGASKGGLLQLTRYLATLLAPQIRVNAITPGGIERGQLEVFQSRYARRAPLGRMATEEDFKGAAAFLASDLSAYVTGHNLVVDGGWTAW